MNNLKTEVFDSWPYDEALSYMRQAQEVVQKDSRAIFIGCGSHQEQVITLGKNPIINKIDKPHLVSNHILIRYLDRGGGATAHEPGQLVLYPVLSLLNSKILLPELISLMENTMLDFIDTLGIKGERSSLGPGIFVEGKKVGFVGMRIKNHITSHGLAINLKNDAKTFSLIDPCGMKTLKIGTLKDYISLEQQLNFYIQLLLQHFLYNLNRQTNS